jgi:hypothetical protein
MVVLFSTDYFGTSVELPFSKYVLVMDESKNQPYLHGFGLA